MTELQQTRLHAVNFQLRSAALKYARACDTGDDRLEMKREHELNQAALCLAATVRDIDQRLVAGGIDPIPVKPTRSPFDEWWGNLPKEKEGDDERIIGNSGFIIFYEECKEIWDSAIESTKRP